MYWDDSYNGSVVGGYSGYPGFSSTSYQKPEVIVERVETYSNVEVIQACNAMIDACRNKATGIQVELDKAQYELDHLPEITAFDETPPTWRMLQERLAPVPFWYSFRAMFFPTKAMVEEARARVAMDELRKAFEIAKLKREVSCDKLTADITRLKLLIEEATQYLPIVEGFLADLVDANTTAYFSSGVSCLVSPYLPSIHIQAETVE